MKAEGATAATGPRRSLWDSPTVLSLRRRFIPDVAKRLADRYGPLSRHYANPIAQVYVVHEDFETYLCVNNFLSLLAPEQETRARTEVALYGADGGPVLRDSLELEHRGSVAISVRELLDRHGVRSDVGLATVRHVPLVARASRDAPFREAGELSSHFFTYYLDKKSQSMAIIHPQSSIGEPPGAERGADRGSCQTIFLDHLDRFRVYQPNCSRVPASVVYTVHDFASRRELLVRTLDVPPAGVAWFDVKPEELDGAKVVTFSMNRRPSPNGKPLLMRMYPHGRFSMSHS